MLERLGAHRVTGVLYEYPRPERSRSAGVARAQDPVEALVAYGQVQGWTEDRVGRLVETYRHLINKENAKV